MQCTCYLDLAALNADDMLHTAVMFYTYNGNILVAIITYRSRWYLQNGSLMKDAWRRTAFNGEILSRKYLFSHLRREQHF